MTAPEATASPVPRDLLSVRWLGPMLLRRRLWQGLLLLFSLVLVLHGLLGPQLAPKNLATLGVWVHYRGLLVLALLVAGNLFCLACPFVLARDFVRRFARPLRAWPRALRGKGPGIVLLIGVLYAYELWDLWASPWGTAALILAYFALIMIVDGFFAGAPFCKSVCPIGQFNFVASALSPLEVRVRDASVCSTCEGHECLRGSDAAASADTAPAGVDDPFRAVAPAAAPPRVARRGCELNLFLPEKAGNMDCTFCLDCARACPEDNVVLATRLPAAELLEDRSGSGVGRRSRRSDLALLGVVFTFGALVNAFGMVSPVYATQQAIADVLGTTSEAAVLGVLWVGLLVVEPALLLGAAAWLARRALRGRVGLSAVVVRFAHGLVPLGVGVWAAHYGFHLLTGLWTIVPVAQRAAMDAGVPLLGTPDWGVGGLPESVVQPIELSLLLVGTAGSLAVLWSIARREAPARPLGAFWPWASLTLLLLATAVWLLAQPMEMRGTFLGA